MALSPALALLGACSTAFSNDDRICSDEATFTRDTALIEPLHGGRIDSIFVTQPAEVRAGQPLLAISPRRRDANGRSVVGPVSTAVEIVRSPTGGRLTIAGVEPGTQVAAHSNIGIVEGHREWVVAAISEKAIARVREGAKAMLSIPDAQGQTLLGKVESISPVVSGYGTRNWYRRRLEAVKTPQTIDVRIALEPRRASVGRMRSGTIVRACVITGNPPT